MRKLPGDKNGRIETDGAAIENYAIKKILAGPDKLERRVTVLVMGG